MDIEKKRAFIINVIYLGILAAFFAVTVKWLIPMLAPFVAACVVVYLLRRPTRFVCEKFGLKKQKKAVAMLLVLVFYSTVGSLIALLSVRLVSGIRDLVVQLPRLYTVYAIPIISDLFIRFENFAYRLDTNLFSLIQGYDEQLLQWMGSFISSISGKAVGAASSVATAIPGLFIQLVLMVISSFFLAADYHEIKLFLLRQMGVKTARLFIQIKEYVVGTLFACIGSYFIIASITFVELSIGLRLLGLRRPTLIAFCISVFDILPVMGTGGIMIPWAVLTLLQGKFTLGLGLLAVYVAITVIRNIIEPKIVGGRLGLHPVVTLASMFLGAQLFGVIGLFGFPIGLSLLRYLNDNGSIHILK